ncbi:prepilin-type N-terminal cleavage/methylation domain-containing protein [Brevibacillus ruminantium]|uniref:Prepilin-type N-terminal cleavage/methylation domain-containing protein n=1 Tax=Brevibacillus ruminantium TaxID=2950604 RepID=A0ABY4WH61_9BACL|nr:prepilin-type N-terminal cleavage/methylation domain-containing protein [Brevibacillus ruminantium]USG64669.1 prepilin-type N-terminal cleavage/methylation domain-containing protein [Brevibacillus ruminantium]
MFRRYLKDQRGLTLVELLAVVVILGIIAAIAIPSIGNIIENSRKDAHIANAQMLGEAARMAATTKGVATGTFTLEELQKEGLIGDIQVPGESGKNYDPKKSEVTIETDKNSKKLVTTVTLTADGRKKAFIDDIDISTLERANVHLEDN